MAYKHFNEDGWGETKTLNMFNEPDGMRRFVTGKSDWDEHGVVPMFTVTFKLPKSFVPFEACNYLRSGQRWHTQNSQS